MIVLFVLHVADLSWIPSIPFGLLSTTRNDSLAQSQEHSLSSARYGPHMFNKCKSTHGQCRVPPVSRTKICLRANHHTHVHVLKTFHSPCSYDRISQQTPTLGQGEAPHLPAQWVGSPSFSALERNPKTRQASKLGTAPLF